MAELENENNVIRASIALGVKSGFFVSGYREGDFTYGKNGFKGVLENPYMGGSDSSLGRLMKDHQHIRLKFLHGGELTEKDLAFLCDFYGTAVADDNEGELGLNALRLKPFEILLIGDIFDFTDKTEYPMGHLYTAENVRAGLNFGSDRGKLSIRYDLVPKE